MSVNILDNSKTFTTSVQVMETEDTLPTFSKNAHTLIYFMSAQLRKLAIPSMWAFEEIAMFVLHFKFKCTDKVYYGI